MRRIGAHARTLVVNDALVALEAGAPGAPGVVIISGTGSIAYGRNTRNEGARSGGWGHVLGDEGSGFWIGRAAIRAVLREADRRGPRTTLTPLLLQHFGVSRGAEPDPRGLPEQPAARRDRLARALRADRLHRGRRGRVGHPPRGGRRARVVGRERGETPRHGRRRHFRSSWPEGSSAPFRGCARRCSGGFRWPFPNSTARLLDREPAAGAVSFAIQEATGGARIPRYRLRVMGTPGPPRIAIFPDEARRRPRAGRRHCRRARGPCRPRAGPADGPDAGASSTTSWRRAWSSRAADLSRTTTFNLDEFLGHPGRPPGQLSQLHERAPLRPREPRGRADSFPRTVPPAIRRKSARATSVRSPTPAGSTCRFSASAPTGTSASTSRRPALQARTHRVTLEPETRRGNAALFGGDPAAVPAEALSMGIATILQARRIVLIATGSAKAAIVERLLRGPMTTGRAGVVPAAAPRRRDRHGRGGGGRSQGVLIRARGAHCRGSSPRRSPRAPNPALSSTGAAPAAGSASPSASRSPP